MQSYTVVGLSGKTKQTSNTLPHSSKCRIFGLQRSGTNFLEQLLCTNSHDISVQINQKHSLNVPADFDDSINTFVVYKNPYTWIESICFRNKVDWIKKSSAENSTMLHLYPALEHIDNKYKIGTHKINLVNLCKAYNHFHRNWKNVEATCIRFIKYEDLLSDNKVEVIQSLLQFVDADVSDVKIPGPGKVSQSKRYTVTDEEYYKKSKPKYLTDEQIAKANEFLKDDIFEFLGYEKIK